MAAVEAAKTRARRATASELGLMRIGFTGSASFNSFVTGAIRDYRAATGEVRYVRVLDHAPAAPMVLVRSEQPDNPLASIFTQLTPDQL